MKYSYVIFGLILLVAVSGCAKYTAQTPQTWSKHQQQLRALTHWQMTGVVGTNTPDNAQTIYVRWQQERDQYALWFSGPLGVNNARLQGESGRVVLTLSDGKTYHAKTPEQLIKQQLGWSLPISSLKEWIIGLPAKGEKRLSLSPDNRLRDLYQYGWHIHYENYQRVDTIHLPSKLIISGQNLTAIILIKSWSTGVDKPT